MTEEIINLVDFYNREIQVLVKYNTVVQVLSGPESCKKFVGEDLLSFNAAINLK